jgi:hypothetical protein
MVTGEGTGLGSRDSVRASYLRLIRLKRRPSKNKRVEYLDLAVKSVGGV